MSNPSPFTRLKWAARRPNFPIVTWVILALCVVLYAAQFLTDTFAPAYSVTQALAYVPFLTASEPWRMLTSIFIHGNILHILFNGYSLYVMGSVLEPMLGKPRFITLFLIGGFGGSVGVALLASPTTGVVGASGAIFAMMGAFLIIMRKLGIDNRQFLIVVAINLVWGFFWSGIAWQAHVGGLVVGLALGAIYSAYRLPTQRNLLWGSVALLSVGLVVITIAAWMIKIQPWLVSYGFAF